jgi:hypothetical protein
VQPRVYTCNHRVSAALPNAEVPNEVAVDLEIPLGVQQTLGGRGAQVANVRVSMIAVFEIRPPPTSV